MKLPAHRAGLPGNVISFYIVPLDPAYEAGLAGHVPATYRKSPHLIRGEGFFIGEGSGLGLKG